MAGLLQGLGGVLQGFGRHPEFREQAAVAQGKRHGADRAGNPAPRQRMETIDGEGHDPVTPGLRPHRRGKAVLTSALQGGSQAQYGPVRRLSGCNRGVRQGRGGARSRDDVGDLRLAFGQRAGLVESNHLHGMGAFQRRRVADQDPAPCRNAGAHHDGRRRGKTERAGACDHQDRHRVQHRLRRIAGRKQPRKECRQRDDQNDRHEHGADPIGQPLDRRLGRLRALHQPHDARQHGFSADGGGFYDQAAVRIDRARGHLPARPGINGKAFAGQHGGVDRGVPLDDGAVHRNTLAGTHDHRVPDPHLGDGHVHLLPVAQQARGVGAEFHQRADGGCGLPPCPSLQPLAQQDEGDQDGGGFVIEPVVVARGKPRPRREQHPGGQAPGRRCAQGHEQVHVARQGARGVPPRGIEPPPQPELHRGRERKLRPARQHQRGHDHPGQQRHGQGGRGQQVEQFTAVVPSRFWNGSGPHDLRRAVAGLLHRALQGRDIRMGAGDDVRALGRQIHADVRNAGHGAQYLLDPPHAGGAGHAGDGEIDLFGIRADAALGDAALGDAALGDAALGDDCVHEPNLGTGIGAGQGLHPRPFRTICAAMRAALITAGCLLLVLGLAWPWLAQLGARIPFGELPGDIRVERPGFSFFAPLGSSLVISVVVSVVISLLFWLWRR